MALRKDENQNLTAPGQAVQEHPLFSGRQSVGMISGENPRFQAQASGHEAMGEQLKNMGLKAEPREGRYGAPEKSWMVYGPSREQMFQLGRQFGQESVVYSQGGKHELLYTNGPNTGRYHPALDHEWFQSEPEDYYTKMPEHGGYLRLNFDWDTLHPSNLLQPEAIAAQQVRASHGTPQAPAQQTTDGDVSKSEIKAALVVTLKKALMTYADVAGFAAKKPAPHPNAYEWHNEHTDHHLHHAAPGVVLRSRASNQGLAKAMPAHPHMDGSKPPVGTSHLTAPNDQAAGTGVSTYAKFAMPYGTVDKQNPTDLFHYPYQGKNHEIDKLVKDHGYNVYYAGGKFGKPDLANRNYNTKHLMIYDPSPGSGGDFGTEAYTDGWRKIHELSHALTYPELNQIYGEGRRIGKLGTHRTLREALRAVHWEWLAAHKQRELNQQVGIHVPDHVFNKELNTVMHDAIHRAVTGKFTEPSGEGFRPHEHQVPLETALGMVREAGHNLGITGMHDLIKKSEEPMADEKTYEPQEWRQQLAKAVKDRVDAYSKSLLELRQRELKKNLAADPALAGPAPQMNPLDKCPLCGQEDVPGKCKCLAPLAAPAPVVTVKNEISGYAGSSSDEMMGKGEMCKSCGQAHMGKSCGSPVMDKPGSGRPGDPMKKEELKVAEPVKAQKGSGGKITKLKLKKAGLPHLGGKDQVSQAMTNHAMAAAPKPGAAAPAAKVKLPGQAEHAARAQSFNDFMPAGKFSAPAAAPKLAAPAAAPKPALPAKPAAPAATPPAGMGHLKPPSPAAAPGGTPKIPGMAKPAAAPAPALPKPALPKAAGPAMGKNEIKKSETDLGKCVLCQKAEHAGQCA